MLPLREFHSPLSLELRIANGNSHTASRQDWLDSFELILRFLRNDKDYWESMTSSKTKTIKKTDIFLLPQHQQVLDDSAISSEVVSVRGYRTVTVKAELRRLGFKDNQCRVPGLLIDLWPIIEGHLQSRLDHDRLPPGVFFEGSSLTFSNKALMRLLAAGASVPR